jgi:putative inorganic carbon (hco3(-)) transporter
MTLVGALRPAGTGAHGTVGAAGLATLAIATIASTWIALPVAAGLAIVLMVAIVYATTVWPRAMLIVAGIVPLADPFTFMNVLGPSAVPWAQFVSEGLLLLVGSVIVARAARIGLLREAFDHPATPWLLAFTAVVGASALLNAVPPHVALAGFLFTVEAIAFFYLARMVGFTLRSATWGLAVLVVIMAGIAASAILQALLAPDILWFRAFSGSFGEGGRVTGFFGNPNSLGAMIGLVLPLPAFAVTALRGRWRLIAAIVTFVMLLALLLSFSRGAWLGTLVALPLVAILADRRALVAVTLLGAAALLTASAMPRNLLVETGTEPPVVEGEPVDDPGFIFVGTTVDRVKAVGDSDDLRLRFLVEGLPIIADRPVLGAGPGRYGGAAAVIFDSPVYEQYGTSLYGFHTVHDFWLHMAGEVGVVGALTFAGFLVAIGRRGLLAARRSAGIERALIAGCLGGMLAMSINTLTEMLLEGNSTAFPFWLVVALGAVIAERRVTAQESELTADDGLPERSRQDPQVEPE